jgi:hypothetical protein
MSNPVEPNPYGANVPPAPGQGYPPPQGGAPGFPPPNAGGQGFPPAGGQGFPPAGGHGFPPPQGGAPGFPPAPGAAAFPPAGMPPAPKKSGGKKALSILGVIAVGLVIFGLKFGLRSALDSDATEKAKVGDCISVSEELKDEATETKADLVKCTDSDAKFVVVGRVDGTDDVNGTACDKFFKDTDKDPAILSSPPGVDKKYVLCVKAPK